MDENQKWNNVMKEEKEALDETISSLNAENKKFEVSSEPLQRKGIVQRELVGYANTYTNEQPIRRKGKPKKRKVANQNILFENTKKIKDIILKIVIAASLAGTVAFVAKFIEKANADELTDNTTIEQEYTPDQIAAQYAQHEKNTPSEVEYIQDVNNGEYKDPLITDQFSTEKTGAPHVSEYKEEKDDEKHVNTWSTTEGYTPLSQDPNYNPPTDEDLKRLRENAQNQMTR